LTKFNLIPNKRVNATRDSYRGAIPIAIVDLNALYSTTRERTLRQKLSVFLSVLAS